MLVTDASGNAVEEDSATAAELAATLATATNRANHTGTQPASTISDFSTQVNTIINAQKGANNGIASLDGGGKVPSSQLPSYVDDVLEFATLSAFPTPGETGKIYVALDTNLIYRWSGSAYIKIADGAVVSVFGRTGVVVASGDDYAAHYVRYDASQAIGPEDQAVARENIGAAGLTYDNTFTGINIFQSETFVGTPTSGGHAVNRDYVDSEIATAVAGSMVWTSTNW